MSNENKMNIIASTESKINKTKKSDHVCPYLKTYNDSNFNLIVESINDDKQKKNIQSTLEFYIKVSLLGILRGAIGLIWEHPLDSIKTQWQTNVHIRKSSEIINYIYKEKGIIGFYRGFFPNLIRQTSKNLYRWPLMLFFPKFFKKINDIFFNSYNSDGFCKIQTGLAIANIETFLISPLERLKIYFMTHKNIKDNKHSFLVHFYVSNKGKLIKQLFKGLEASLYRSNISWVTFLYFDYKGKRFIKSYSQKDELAFVDLLFVSIFVGIGNLFFSNKFFYLFL